jgi:hypothetical protein
MGAQRPLEGVAELCVEPIERRRHAHHLRVRERP